MDAWDRIYIKGTAHLDNVPFITTVNPIPHSILSHQFPLLLFTTHNPTLKH